MNLLYSSEKIKYGIDGSIILGCFRASLPVSDLRSTQMRRPRTTGHYEIISRSSLRRFPQASDYLDSLHSRNLCANTIYNIGLEIARFTEDLANIGANPLQPGRQHWQAYLEMLRRRNTEASVSVAVSRLHGYLMFLIEIGILNELPYDTRIEPPWSGNGYRERVRPAARRSRSCKQRRLLLPSHATIDRVFEAMVPEARVPANIARQVGARISEILQIPEVWHTRQTDRDGVSILNVITKGGKRGSLHFGPGIARETGNNLDKHQKFIRADGRPWTRFTLSGEIRRAADSVGAKTFNFHTLRHVFASRAFQVLHLDAQTDPRNGALDPVLMVQYLLNHSSPQTTMSTYLHNFAFEPGDTIPDAEMHAVRTLFQAVPAHINHGDIQL